MASSAALLLASCVCLATLTPGCASEVTSQPQSTARASAPVPQSKIDPIKTTCPPGFAGANRKSVCKVAQVRVGLSPCNDRGPGGYDIMVSGISCQEGRGLRLPLIHLYGPSDQPRETVYRAWTARGSLRTPVHVTPVEASGWICWAGYDPKGSVGVWHACWRGSDLLLFKAG